MSRYGRGTVNNNWDRFQDDDGISRRSRGRTYGAFPSIPAAKPVFPPAIELDDAQLRDLQDRFVLAMAARGMDRDETFLFGRGYEFSEVTVGAVKSTLFPRMSGIFQGLLEKWGQP